MMVETKADFAQAFERLRRRDTESLAAFILSLAQDSGPVGEQVRTFIVGDVVAEAAEVSAARRVTADRPKINSRAKPLNATDSLRMGYLRKTGRCPGHVAERSIANQTGLVNTAGGRRFASRRSGRTAARSPAGKPPRS